MSERDDAIARAIHETREQDCVLPEPKRVLDADALIAALVAHEAGLRQGREEAGPDDDGMRMLSMVPVIGVLTLVTGWVLYRGLVALAAWVTR